MLARYQPAEWAGHIDIDSRRHAAIEKLLKEALDSANAPPPTVSA
jgi:hypothetical protein